MPSRDGRVECIRVTVVFFRGGVFGGGKEAERIVPDAKSFVHLV